MPLSEYFCRERQGATPAIPTGQWPSKGSWPLPGLLTRFPAVGGRGFPRSWVWEQWKKGSGVPALGLFQEKGACLCPHVISSRVTEP